MDKEQGGSHTEGPWSVGNIDAAISEPAIFSDTAHGIVARISRRPGVYAEQRSEQLANAAYIVRACNTFPELLEALEEAADALLVLAGAEPPEHDWHPQHSLSMAWRAGDKARVALAKAGGGNG